MVIISLFLGCFLSVIIALMLIRIIHNIFFYLVVIISYFVGTAAAFCFAPFFKNKTIPYQIAAQIWSKTLLPFSGVRLSTNGLDNFPKDSPVIIVANHQGAADIPALLSTLPVRFRFAIKKELFDIPIFGWFLKQAGYFPIDRQVVLSAYKMVETIVNILKSGESVLIFPEGTRSFDGSLGKFKRGSLMAALKSGAPVIPVAISGSYHILPRGTKWFRPAKIKISIGPPVYFNNEEEYESKVEAIRETIAKML